MGAILKQQKRKHKKSEVDLTTHSLKMEVDSKSEPEEQSLSPLSQPDNEWIVLDTRDSVPDTADKWNNCVFIDKTHIGYYCWPKPLMSYAPISEQPPLGRERNELEEVKVN